MREPEDLPPRDDAVLGRKLTKLVKHALELLVVNGSWRCLVGAGAACREIDCIVGVDGVGEKTALH